MKILLNGAETALITLNKEETDAGVFVTPTLFSETKITVDTVEFVFDVPKINALAFNNGFCTNDFVSVAPLDEEFMSRDIVMVKGDDGMLSVGTVTAERFLTRYFTSREKCVFRIELENREYSGKVLLEKFVYSRTKTGGEFFSAYCDLLKMEYDIKLPEKIDTGWSSWSYYYRNITEEECRKQEKLLRENYPWADLIQIDDGWQTGDTFSSCWKENGETFKNLEKPFGSSRLGLWMSPTLAQDDSDMFLNHNELIQKENGKNVRSCAGNVIQVEGDGSAYPLDIGQEKVRELIAQSVKDVKEKYNCNYFKLDFLVRSLIRQSVKNDVAVHYEKDTNVKLYRDLMRLIREKAGKDTFLMACGAPITESAGVFDSIRYSPDITWCMRKHVGFWTILKKDIQNIFLRSYYHGKVFICDPDALIVRGHKSFENDDFLPDLEEARVWASAVALSGGTVLINEDISALEEDRKALVDQVMQPIGIAAEPEDFFEQPYCAHVCISLGKKRIKGVFNLDETEKDEVIKNDIPVFAFDCWSKEYLGSFPGDIEIKNMPAHSCRVILLVEQSETGFIASNDNLFMGIEKENITSGWFNDGKNIFTK